MTLVGIALAVHGLRSLTGRSVMPEQIAFPEGRKPHAADLPDFSISHCEPWAGCAVVSHGRVGFDVESLRPLGEQSLRLLGADEGHRPRTLQAMFETWTAREAVLKACGATLAGIARVQVDERTVVYGSEVLHRRQLRVFDGAAACIATSYVLSEVQTCPIELDALFAL